MYELYDPEVLTIVRACRFEETLHRFQNMLIDKLQGGRHQYRIPHGDEQPGTHPFTD